MDVLFCGCTISQDLELAVMSIFKCSDSQPLEYESLKMLSNSLSLKSLYAIPAKAC